MTAAETVRGDAREIETLRGVWARPHILAQTLATVDHKRVGLRYIVTAFVFFLVGGIEAGLMRTQLAVADNEFLGPDTYNQIFTMHGTTMIFYFATPMLIGLGTYVIPLMIGSRDLAFPRLNAFGYWVFLASGIFMYTSFLVEEVPDGGWFAYVPLTDADFSPGLGMDFWTLGILFLGTSTTAAAITFVVTILRMRAPGMGVQRMPLLLWGYVDMAFTILIALPSLTLATALLALDRHVGTQFFDPDGGGSPLLWQHLFWIWGHPEVYILLLPALGIISTVVAVHARRPIILFSIVAVASIAIGILAFGLWVHHMFSTGLDLLPITFFAAASFTIAIPSGISIFAWLATILGGRVSFTVPMMYALGFIVTFVIGGITGVMVAMVPFDWQVHDSFFVVAHFHYVLVGGVVFPIFGALYHWWPKITGFMPSPVLGHTSFWLVLAGFNITFFPQHIVGMLGMPRRVYTYAEGLGWEIHNLISSSGYVVLALGVIVLVWDLLTTPRRGVPAGDDPWRADSLEWATSSPPPPYNFERLPIVHGRSPMWEDRTPERGGDLDRIEEPLDQGREVVTTSILDGAPDAILRMPGPTYLPLLAALALTGSVTATLLEAYFVGAVFLAAVGLVVAAWLWRSPEDAPERIEVIRERSHLPFVILAGPHALGRWGMSLFLVTEGVLFGSSLSSYFLVRGNSDEWPQGGIEPPDLLLPAVLTVLLVACSASIQWSRAQTEADRERPVALRLGLLVTMALGVAFLVLQGLEFRDVGYGPTDNAYASLFFTITGAHWAHVAVGVLILGWVLVRTWFVSHEPRRRSDMPNIAWFWHFLTLIWLAVFAVLYVGVRWL